MKPSFTIGQPVRYRPGSGTYGYEDDLEADGRLPGVVIGHTPAGRVQVDLTLAKRRGQTVRRTVARSSLEPAGSTSHKLRSSDPADRADPSPLADLEPS